MLWIQMMVWGAGIFFGGLTVGYFAPNLTVGSVSMKLGAFVAACASGQSLHAVWESANLDCSSARTVLDIVDAVVAAGGLLAITGAFQWLRHRRARG